MSTNQAEAASGGSFDLLRRATAKMLYNRSVTHASLSFLTSKPPGLHASLLALPPPAIQLASTSTSHLTAVVPSSKSLCQPAVSSPGGAPPPPKWRGAPCPHGKTPTPRLLEPLVWCDTPDNARHHIDRLPCLFLAASACLHFIYCIVSLISPARAEVQTKWMMDVQLAGCAGGLSGWGGSLGGFCAPC